MRVFQQQGSVKLKIDALREQVEKVREQQNQGPASPIILIGAEMAGKSTLANQVMAALSPFLHSAPENLPSDLEQSYIRETESNVPLAQDTEGLMENSLSESELALHPWHKLDWPKMLKTLSASFHWKNKANRVGVKGLAPAVAGVDACTGAAVHYHGRKGQNTIKVSLTYTSAEEAMRVLHDYATRLKSAARTCKNADCLRGEAMPRGPKGWVGRAKPCKACWEKEKYAIKVSQRVESHRRQEALAQPAMLPRFNAQDKAPQEIDVTQKRVPKRKR